MQSHSLTPFRTFSHFLLSEFPWWLHRVYLYSSNLSLDTSTDKLDIGVKTIPPFPEHIDGIFLDQQKLPPPGSCWVCVGSCHRVLLHSNFLAGRCQGSVPDRSLWGKPLKYVLYSSITRDGTIRQRPRGHVNGPSENIKISLSKKWHAFFP